MQVFLRYLFLGLFGLFCFAYPFGVVGVAFDVQSPFPLAWAGSAMLYLEGTLLIVSAMLVYERWPTLLAGLCVIVLSYAVEALGVTTGFPFGSYRYTGILFPTLPAGVSFPVMFAWILVVFGGYGIVRNGKAGGRAFGLLDTLLAATLAMLLDLAIEPVSTYIEHYWQWFDAGPLNYYGVPLTNFVSWFVVAFLLLLLVGRVCSDRSTLLAGQSQELARKYAQKMEPSMPLNWATESAWGASHVSPLSSASASRSVALSVAAIKRRSQLLFNSMRLARVTPMLVFSCSLFMFGLIDLTHGYSLGTLFALIAGVIVYLRR